MQEFLRSEFYSGAVEHFIFWGRIGHVGVRARGENQGIPTTLAKTWRRNCDWLSEFVFPLVDWDRTVVLVHPDHGTRRRGLSLRESMHDGFVLSSRSLPFPVRCWADLGETVERFAKGAM